MAKQRQLEPTYKAMDYGKDDESGSWISVLIERHDDNIYIYIYSIL